MRQLRGSGSGFGFELPTISGSAKKTPTPAKRSSSRSTSQPPRFVEAITTPTPAQPRRLSRRTPNTRVPHGNASGEENAAAIAQRESDGSITKKRRVTVNATTPVNQLDALEDIAEEGDEDDASRIATLQTEADQSTPGKKRKKRKSVLLKSRRKSRPSLDATEARDTSSSSARADVEEQTVLESEVGTDEVLQNEVSSDQALVDELLESQDQEDEAEEIDVLQDDEIEDAGLQDGALEDNDPENEGENDMMDGDGDDGNDEIRNESAEDRATPSTYESRPLKTSKVSSGTFQPERSNAERSDNALTKHKKKKRRSIIKGRTKHRSSGDRSVLVEQVEATNEHQATDPTSTGGQGKGGSLKRPTLKLPRFGRKRSLHDENGEEAAATGSNSAREQEDDGSGRHPGLKRSTLLKKKRPLTESKGNVTAQQRNEVDKPNMEKPKQATKSTMKKATSADQISVTVHRLSHVHRLNFNPDVDDPLSGPGAFPKKKTPNAIDVLAQICREIIGKTLTTVKDNIKTQAGNKDQLLGLKRKREAIETYGDELDGRLFQMATALDHNYALGVKLKHANKQKTALRDEVLDLRRQRQEMELQIDEVRARHEEEAREADEEYRLNTLLQDIELAVERGRTAPEESDDDDDEDERGVEGGEGRPNLMMRLQQVTDRVSSADGRIGMLDRVKAFNGLLEEAIAKL